MAEQISQSIPAFTSFVSLHYSISLLPWVYVEGPISVLSICLPSIFALARHGIRQKRHSSQQQKQWKLDCVESGRSSISDNELIGALRE
ncbi:MAG: hypothetical protein Q9227_004551 [Pyrenula ochraceoflavens]